MYQGPSKVCYTLRVASWYPFSPTSRHSLETKPPVGSDLLYTVKSVGIELFLTEKIFHLHEKLLPSQGPAGSVPRKYQTIVYDHPTQWVCLRNALKSSCFLLKCMISCQFSFETYPNHPKSRKVIRVSSLSRAYRWPGTTQSAYAWDMRLGSLVLRQGSDDWPKKQGISPPNKATRFC